MSNYTKATNFATKDTLPTGDAGKIVKGTEIDNEFNAIASAISSKADTASPTFTGTPAAPTAVAGTNTTQLATTAFVTTAVTGSFSDTATLTNKTLTSPTITGGTITGGTITGITDLAIADGGTGASTAVDAFTNLKQAASETSTGVVELATVAEVQAATDTTRAVTPAGVAGVAIGVNQTWQNLTSSRTEGTTYTNSTGKPIMLSITAITTTTVDGYANISITINGSVVAYNSATSRGTNQRAGCTIVVPHGATYRADWSQSLVSWWELR